MKTIAALLSADYASGNSTLCTCLLIERTDGTKLRYTSLDADVSVTATVAGVVLDGTYSSGPGLDVASLAASAELSVDNLELSIITDDILLPDVDLIIGRWDAATFCLFETNWADTSRGVNVLKRGTTGNAQMRRPGLWVIELRGLKQALQQTVGAVTTPTCRWRLGDANCGITLATYTVTGAFTSSASQYVATDSGRAEAAEYFSEGVLTITSGSNAGLSQKVKAFSTGAFTFSLPFPFPIVAGVTYSVYAGCRKRLAEDCVAKFANARRFGGEPHLPGIDKLARPPEYSA